MKFPELISLLSDATSVDPRVEVFERAVNMWWKLVGDLDAQDAADALVAHYRESSDRVMPADIRRRVREARRARAEAIPSDVEVMADVEEARPAGVMPGDLTRLLQQRRAAMIDKGLSLEEARLLYPPQSARNALTPASTTETTGDH